MRAAVTPRTCSPANPWTTALYHFDATNAALQTNLTGRIPFQNPIVAFWQSGERQPAVCKPELQLRRLRRQSLHHLFQRAAHPGLLPLQLGVGGHNQHAGARPGNNNQLAVVTNGFTQTLEQLDCGRYWTHT